MAGGYLFFAVVTTRGHIIWPIAGRASVRNGRALCAREEHAQMPKSAAMLS